MRTRQLGSKISMLTEADGYTPIDTSVQGLARRICKAAAALQATIRLIVHTTRITIMLGSDRWTGIPRRIPDDGLRPLAIGEPAVGSFRHAAHKWRRRVSAPRSLYVSPLSLASIMDGPAR